MFGKVIFITLILGIPLFAEHYISNGKEQALYALKSDRNNNNTSVQYFANSQGIKLGVNHTLIICFNDTHVQTDIQTQFHLTYMKQLSPNMFLYALAKDANTLEIANTIATQPGVKFSHPNFLIHKKAKSADPYYQNQWHLKNNEYANADINVEEAWQYTKGANVIAAIFDEGIDIDHKDLRENIIGFANFNDPTSNYPDSKSGKWHGTACAGLLAAAENGTGTVGVAPQSKLYAVRYADQNIANDIEAFTYLMNQNVDIISNSWGSYVNLDAYNEIFKTLATKGRDGKGILIFFATGNDQKNLDDPDINDESESPYVISIGASTHKDGIAEYNNYGSTLDFLAPGGISSGELVTTDATGEKGYTDWNYNFNFIGTSASTPIAAGVAALMLSVNPDLTRDEVIEILKKTSKKVGNYDYINGRNDHAGYGRIDAGKAVKMAKSYHQTLQPLDLENFAYTMFQSLQ